MLHGDTGNPRGLQLNGNARTPNGEEAERRRLDELMGMWLVLLNRIRQCTIYVSSNPLLLLHYSCPFHPTNVHRESRIDSQIFHPAR